MKIEDVVAVDLLGMPSFELGFLPGTPTIAVVHGGKVGAWKRKKAERVLEDEIETGFEFHLSFI